MIIKIFQRPNRARYTRHLANAEDNERVFVVSSRDLAAGDDIKLALAEMDARALGTRCKNTLAEVILSPPRTGQPGTRADKLAALSDFEDEHPEFKGQPRIIIAHEKDGVEHWHVMYSRVMFTPQPDGHTKAAAINMAHTKIVGMKLSHASFVRMGIEPPAELVAFLENIEGKKREKRGLSMQAYQQAKKMGLNPETLRDLVRQHWGADFRAAMAEHGFQVARGDRRGFVLVAAGHPPIGLQTLLPKGMKIATLREYLGHEDTAQSIEDAQKILRAARPSMNFNRAAGESIPADLRPIKVKLDSITKALKEKAAEGRDMERRQREAEQDALKAHAEMLRELADDAAGSTTILVTPGTPNPTPEQFSAALAASITVESHRPARESIEQARRRLRGHNTKARADLVREKLQARATLERETLAHHAARVLKAARERMEMAFVRFDKIAEKMRQTLERMRPPAPVPRPQPGPAPEKVGPFKTTKEFTAFREAEGGPFKDRDQQQDTGRERTRPGPTKGPRGPGM